MVLTLGANYHTNTEAKLFTRYSLLFTRYSKLVTPYSLRSIRTALHYIHKVYIKLRGSS